MGGFSNDATRWRGSHQRKGSSTSSDELRAAEAAAVFESAVNAPIRPKPKHQNAAWRWAKDYTKRHTTRILGKSKVPDYLIFNDYILTGYRVNFTIKDSFKSIFTLHNETLNIWTHVAGFFIFLGLFIALAIAPPLFKSANRSLEALHLLETASASAQSFGRTVQRIRTELQLGRNIGSLQKALSDVEYQDVLRGLHIDEGAESVKRMFSDIEYQRLVKELGISQGAQHLRRLVAEVKYWPMYVYLVGAMACMLCSSLAHTFSICSPRANKWWWRIDYVGIAVMICCSFYPLVYYIFLEHVYWRRFYMVAITILGTGVATVSLLERFQDDRYRAFRAWIFVALGTCGIFPGVHAICTLDVFSNQSGPFYHIMGYEAGMAGGYLGGALLYATRYPEKAYPGKFDLFFNSHQLFHVMIVLAAYSHYEAGMTCLDWRYGNLA